MCVCARFHLIFPGPEAAGREVDIEHTTRTHHTHTAARKHQVYIYIYERTNERTNDINLYEGKKRRKKNPEFSPNVVFIPESFLPSIAVIAKHEKMTRGSYSWVRLPQVLAD